MIKTGFFTALLAMLLSSCASIFTGIEQHIKVDAEPNSSMIYVNGKAHGTSPADLYLRKGKAHDIVFKKEAYRDCHVLLTNRKLHWIVWLNILSFDIGWLIDSMTGAAEFFTQDYIKAQLIPLAPKVAKSKSVSCCKVKFDIPGTEIGKTYKKGKLTGLMFYNELGINQEQLKNCANEELIELGFYQNSVSPEVCIEGIVKEIEYHLYQERGGSFSSKCKLQIEWIIRKNNTLVDSILTQAEGKSSSKGSHSLELAFKNAFYKFLNNPKIYKSTEAIINTADN